VFKVSLPEEGLYYVSLTVINNLGVKISKEFKLVVSDPIAIIKISPKR
jgi:hypothetical protein